jgi:hypothetical protein
LKIHGCLSAAMAKLCRRWAWPSFPTHDFHHKPNCSHISCFAAEIAQKLAPPFDNRSSICQRHFLSNLLNRKLCYRCNSCIPSQYLCIGCWTELQILANLWQGDGLERENLSFPHPF